MQTFVIEQTSATGHSIAMPFMVGPDAQPAPGFELPHIFITGKAGHGKDSIGDHLIASFGFEKLSFSDGIRIEVAQAYTRGPEPVTKEWQDLREIKELPQARLALAYCNDAEFIATALKAFEQEDQSLFQAEKARTPVWGAMQKATKELKQSHSEEERMLLPRSPRRIQQLWGTEYRRAQDPLYWLNYAEQKTDFSCPQVLTSVRYANELEFGARINAVRIHVERPGFGSAHHHVTEQVLPMDDKTIVVVNTGSLTDLHAKIDSVVARLSLNCLEQPGKRPRISP